MVVVPAASPEAHEVMEQRSKTIVTLVVDRQPLFLAALGTLLGAPPLSARVVTCARTDTALDIVRGRGVDLVFCELRAVPFPGPELVQTLAGEKPAIPVILLGERGDEQQLSEALHSPVAGLFTKDAGLDEFLVGVGAVLSGHRAIGAQLMARVLDRLALNPAGEPGRPNSRLSQTEIEIISMIGDAESIAAIAASRGISHKTVRNHLARIYRKLELHGRTDAMLWAARMGLTSR